MGAFFKLIRFQNLLMIAGCQCILKMFVIEPMLPDSALNYAEFGLLILATLCIAGAGYIINDIEDVKADEINKPERAIVGIKIKERYAFMAYLILNVLGVVLGLFIANLVGNKSLAILFVVFSGLLYLYATQLKGVLIIGNLLVSLLVALSLIIVGVCDVSPVQQLDNLSQTLRIFKIIYAYALFAFLVNFVREIVKDIEDVEGDHVAGLQSLPIVLGRQRAVRVSAALAILTSLVVFGFVYTFVYEEPLAVVYALVAVIGPLWLFSFKAWQADVVKEMSSLSTMLKFIMLSGMLSIVVFYYLFKN